MLKNILKLEGAQQLSKKEQNTIHGGDYTQFDCESAGGTWICIGAPNSWPAECGCVFERDPGIPNT